jgi:RNA polymerase sigma-70 factor, ECF subfamily
MPAGYQDMPEAKLVTRAIQGNKEAFGDLYEMYLNPIFRYIYYRVHNNADAEDLTETVFLKAWEALPAYQISEAPFKAWLYRIAHNVIIDQYRLFRYESSLESQPFLYDDELGPEEKATSQENNERLFEAFSQLEPAYQEVLSLRFISGLSHAETGSVMARSAGAVRVLQHRALHALRNCLEKQTKQK